MKNYQFLPRKLWWHWFPVDKMMFVVLLWSPKPNTWWKLIGHSWSLVIHELIFLVLSVAAVGEKASEDDMRWLKSKCLCTEFIIKSLQLVDSGILLSTLLTALPCLLFSIIIRYPGGSEAKSPPADAGDLDSVPGSGRSPGEGNGNPLQYSCLGNPMDKGAWRATVHGVTKESVTT